MSENALAGPGAPPVKEPFFSRDKDFYKSFFSMMAVLALQNIITYSVNVADNIMLGAYSQTALAGAAAVNQIQYILQQFTVMGLGEGLVVLASQYWGKRDSRTVQRISGIALSVGLAAGLLLTLAALVSPGTMVRFFTDDAGVQAQATAYLAIMRYTYIPFIITNLLLVTLRSVQVVGIAFRLSCVTLVLNVGINYTLIYGRFGFPEMGIRGAAIGTLIARCVELVIILLYCRGRKLPIRLRPRGMFPPERGLLRDYLRVSMPCVVSALLFSSAVAIQTAIFGHISADAMAAASAAGTLFQYCKMIPSSAAAAASVRIAIAVGSGEDGKIRSYARSLQVLFAGIGLLVCGILLCIRGPVLGLYNITPQAREFAMQMTLIQAVVAIGMSYQMPCQVGIIRGGGDTRYVMISDLIYSWAIVVPLSLLAAFVWGWPFFAVAICLNCDQILKCFTVSYKVNRYTWIKKLAKRETADA